MNISEKSLPIVIQFHLKHHCGRGLATLGFRPDRIRTLVSMATDSSHRVIVGDNRVSTIALPFFIGSSFILTGNNDSKKNLVGFEIRQDWTRVCRVS